MALTPQQIAERLLKKGQGVAETNLPLATRGILEEAIPTFSVVTPSAIWADASLIPTTPPVLSNEGELGVVKYYDKLSLEITDAGTTVAYKSPLGQLQNAISGKFGFGYNFKIYTSTDVQIFKGDWLVDAEAGVLLFYNPGLITEGIVNAANPPKITFYKYIGSTGFTNSEADVASLSTALAEEISGRTSTDESLASVLSTEITTREAEALTYLKLSGGTMVGSIDMNGNQIVVNVDPVSGNDLARKSYVDAIAQGLAIHAPVHVVATGETVLYGEDTIDGHLITEGKFVLVNGQTNAAYNGIYVVHSASTWTRRSDADGQPSNEISLGDFVLVLSGDTYASSGWAIGESNAPSGQTIRPDIDTEKWFLVSAPGKYNTDGEGIELSGNTFSLELNGDTLSKDGFGLKVSDSLSTVIADNTTSISTEVSDRIAADSSITDLVTSLSSVVVYNSSVIEVLSGITDILTSEIDTLSSTLTNEISNRIDGDISLTNSITGLTSTISDLDSSVSTEISSLVSTDTVLSTLISTVTSDITTMSTEISLLISTDSSLVTVLSGTITGITSLSTAVSQLASTDSSLSTAITGLTGSLSTLSTALITETSERISADESIITIINNLSGVTSETAGSGLTYNPTEKSLNVNVDNWTIRIINDTIVGAQQWIQDSGTINVTQGTSGSTITLEKDPVTPVSAYVNGIEYLVNPSDSGPSFNRPFFYNEYPPVVGTQIWFDTVTAGFDIVGGIDVVMIKYLIVENLIQ